MGRDLGGQGADAPNRPRRPHASPADHYGSFGGNSSTRLRTDPTGLTGSVVRHFGLRMLRLAHPDPVDRDPLRRRRGPGAPADDDRGNAARVRDVGERIVLGGR